MNPYLPVDRQDADKVPPEEDETCTHEEYHMGRCIACSASQIDGSYPRIVKESTFRTHTVRNLHATGQIPRVIVNSYTTRPNRHVLSKNGIMSVSSVTKNFVIGCLFVLLAIALLYAMNRGLRKQELVACEQLKTYSQKYTAFYLTKADKQMCDSLGIAIYAPVK